MILDNIEGFLLYIEEEGQMIKLERELEIGEEAFFDRERVRKNKVAKLEDGAYMFYRFDEIQTHIENYDSEYSIEGFRDDVVTKLDYETLDYSMDRIELVNELLEDSYGIYDLVSSNRVIEKEQKKKSSFLAESQNLDRQLEMIANYILHPKYSDKQEEDYIEETKEYYQDLKKKKGKTEQDMRELFDVKDEIDLFNQSMITKSREQRNNLRESMEGEFKEIESKNVIVDSADFSKEKATAEYTGRDLEIDKGYWSRMGFSKEQGEFRQEILSTYEEALKILTKQLGIGEGQSVRNKKEKSLRESLGKITYTNDSDKEVNISPTQRVNGIKRMYNELKSDYYSAKEMLTTPIEFNQVDPAKTKFDYNSDTWYEDEEGKIVEVSKNTLLFSNPDTYKGLINNYYRLKDKYSDNFMEDMWYILVVFEDIVSDTELSNEERFVLDKIMKDYSRKEVAEEYEKEFGKTIALQVISSWINRTIPNKMLETYMDSVNEWLYTYKIKGKFKECSKCGEIKTINNDRYFGILKHSKSGFRPICKKCRKV